MTYIENVELVTLCLVEKDNKYLLQDRLKKDWKGFVLPGGHVEKGESIVEAVKREIKEETGLDIFNPQLRGIKQFPIENGRYLVFLFYASQFEGELVSSSEGIMHWVDKKDIPSINTVKDFDKVIQVILDKSLVELQYILEDSKWKALIK